VLCSNSFILCEISGFHGGEYEDSYLLGCCAVQFGRSLTTFKTYLLPPSSEQHPRRQSFSYLLCTGISPVLVVWRRTTSQTSTGHSPLPLGKGLGESSSRSHTVLKRKNSCPYRGLNLWSLAASLTQLSFNSTGIDDKAHHFVLSLSKRCACCFVRTRAERSDVLISERATYLGTRFKSPPGRSRVQMFYERISPAVDRLDWFATSDPSTEIPGSNPRYAEIFCDFLQCL
jgi:hypothetical protein